MVLDGFLYLAALFIIGIAFFVAFVTLNEINTGFQASDMHGDGKAIMTNAVNRMPATFDNMFIFILFLLWILVLVASFSVNSHPLFFAVSLILFIFALAAGAIFSNFYQTFKDDSTLGNYQTQFPFTDWVFDNFVLLIMVAGLAIGLVLYGKIRRSF